MKRHMVYDHKEDSDEDDDGDLDLDDDRDQEYTPNLDTVRVCNLYLHCMHEYYHQ